MPIPLVVSITGDTKGLDKGLDSAGKSATVFGHKFDAGAALKLAGFVGIATAAVGVALELGKAAADDAREAAALELAITNAGAATGDWRAEVEAAIAVGEQLAFTDTQIRDAMTLLVAATGSVTEATGSLALAQDVARLKGIDLEVAANAVAKAENGQARELAKLIGVEAKGVDSATVLAEAQRLAAGQAELYGDSQAGAADRSAIKLAELGEKVGTLLLPVLEVLTDVIGWVIDALTTLADEAAPIVESAMRDLGPVFDIAGRAIGGVIDFVRSLVGWIGDAVGAVGDLIDALAELNPFADEAAKKVGRLGDVGGPSLALIGAGAVGGPAVGGPMTITIYAGADPDAVVRSLVRWTGRNGGRVALDRILER